jgi:glycerophosphoryl diester phosphodiesterase
MWLLPFYPIKESAFEVPMPKIYNDIGRKYFNSRIGSMFGMFLDYLAMDKKLIAHLNARGMFTSFWVLNNEKDFKRAYEVGIQGVMTDYPTKLRSFLRDNPQYENN